MNIELTGREYRIDEKLKALLEKKLNRLEKYFAPDTVAKLTVAQQGAEFKMDLNIFADKVIRAEASGTDVYKLIDMITPRIKRQFRKEHTKEISKVKSSKQSIKQ